MIFSVNSEYNIVPSFKSPYNPLNPCSIPYTYRTQTTRINTELARQRRVYTELLIYYRLLFQLFNLATKKFTSLCIHQLPFFLISFSFLLEV